MGAARASRTAQDWALARAARQTRDPVIYWDEEPQPSLPGSRRPCGSA
jgi:hypothetical protein